MLMSESSYAKSPNIVSRKVAEETVLVPVQQPLGEEACIFTLSEVGARVWELLDGKKSVREIRNAILSEFDVKPEVAEKDLSGLLAQLKRVGAVRPVDTPSEK